MKPVEIVIIVLAVVFVAIMITIALVRKAKGKPPVCSDCAGCPYSKDCKEGNTSQLDACTCNNTQIDNKNRETHKDDVE